MTNHKDRDHALLSASSSHRWLACPPSAVANEGYEDKDTSFAQEGTLAHEVAEAIAQQRVIEHCTRDIYKLPGNPTREMIECAEEYADYIQEHMTSNESIVLLEQRVDFSPWVPDGFGTCDCIILQDKTLTIIDYKFGQGVPVNALNNSQLKLYALGALNDYGIALDEIDTVEMHIFQPRLNNISVDKISVQDLMDWADKTAKPTAEKAVKGKGKYNPGEHCRFCKHAGKCRALTRLCTETLETHGLRVSIPILAPHEVADVLRMEPLISLWLKKVKEQATTTLLEGGELPGYKLVEGKLGNRKWRDEMAVYNVLEGAGYDSSEFTETKVLSPSQLDKAIGKKVVAELLEEHIERAPGSPTLAPIDDKRPAYDKVAEAKKDFE
jgi:hypothetical protein